jgi:hypothetical protein
MPRGLARHVTALDGNPGAAFAYGIVGMHADTGPVGVLSARPWAPRLLRRGNYIDAMVLWRSGELNELGGYTTDHRLWGWEDYELWLRTAETGRYGAFIPQILTRYRATRHSMLSLTNISATTAVSVLCERYPRTMQGVVPPR